MERKTIQDLFIRACRDSGFRLKATTAAVLTGNVLGISPLEVWVAFSGVDQMDQIASGDHPAARSK